MAPAWGHSNFNQLALKGQNIRLFKCGNLI